MKSCALLEDASAAHGNIVLRAAYRDKALCLNLSIFTLSDHHNALVQLIAIKLTQVTRYRGRASRLRSRERALVLLQACFCSTLLWLGVLVNMMVR
jgi:hypothetical protein